jgi:ATP-dependent Lhr-like helicase
MDIALEVPRSPLEAVMSHEVWEEYYDRLAELIGEHRTTLVFVNTRRMAERLARHLSDRLGEPAVTAHHGSLSKEKRLDAESRLKAGQLRALVATASLELGIDIGAVDLVCQIGSPHRISTFLQRVGRSGHTIAGLPKGRLFPVSRDDLVECAALLRSVGRGELDQVVSYDMTLDVLAQQIVAEAACRDCPEDELFALVRRAWPYRALERSQFDAVVAMVSEGFATKRGHRAALVHRDEVNQRVRGRRGSRLLALSSGGAIPEVADYRVVLDPEDTFIGTVNEDFAIESIAGDVFQLGNASWRILQVGAGVVRVSDAKGAPPTIPFWLGEAPARSDELSRAVSDLRADVDAALKGCATGEAIGGAQAFTPAVDWFAAETGVSRAAAEQAVSYLADARRALGVLPTQQTLVLERFFDESGGMQLVLHAPFGSRINKAWGLALRKRFCRQFNFELQAAATEDSLLLSLGPQHSFPLADVFRYLHSATARDVLVQAFLDAPVFQTRWRWNTTISLAVPRNRNGKKVPAQLQRMLADDLMAAVFPDAAACFENIPGDRQIPDHPLVNQTVRDCLQEAMDFDGLAGVLDRIHGGDLRCVARDTPEPSALSHEILNARPYAFLDDAPIEERRTMAVHTRRASEPSSAGDVGALDPAAIERVREEQRPDPRDADELHDVLLTVGFLTSDEARAITSDLFVTLAATGRAGACSVARPFQGRGGPEGPAPLPWVAAERLPELRAVHPDLVVDPPIEPPPSRTARAWTKEAALVELVRGRLTITGPTTARALAESLDVEGSDIDTALLTLESQGIVLRGHFSGPNEFCDRRLLARIHRYTLNRLRAEIEPVSPADFMRFLFAWQHVDASARLVGTDGVRSVIEQLDGYQLAADAWERSVLRSRIDGYEPAMLDTLCLTGEVGWARLSTADGAVTEMGGATPVALFLRAEYGRDGACSARDIRDRRAGQARPLPVDSSTPAVGETARRVLEHLLERGASFAHELVAACGVTAVQVGAALGELVSAGLVASDGFGGLRSIIRSTGGWKPRGDGRALVAGRWFALPAPAAPDDEALGTQARTLLRRYGIVFRRLLARESAAFSWRELVGVYRRLEARGEIRGGRFVSGMSGEQFALPDAVERMREIRRTAPDGRLTTISGCDPLNLAGIVDSGERVRAIGANRLVYRDGVAVAAMEGDYLRPLSAFSADEASRVATALAGRPMPAVLSGFIGR